MFLQSSKATDDAGKSLETVSEERDLRNFEAVQVIETSAGEMRIDKNGRVFILRK